MHNEKTRWLQNMGKRRKKNVIVSVFSNRKTSDILSDD